MPFVNKNQPPGFSISGKLALNWLTLLYLVQTKGHTYLIKPAAKSCRFV